MMEADILERKSDLLKRKSEQSALREMILSIKRQRLETCTEQLAELREMEVRLQLVRFQMYAFACCSDKKSLMASLLIEVPSLLQPQSSCL